MLARMALSHNGILKEVGKLQGDVDHGHVCGIIVGSRRGVVGKISLPIYYLLLTKTTM